MKGILKNNSSSIIGFDDAISICREWQNTGACTKGIFKKVYLVFTNFTYGFSSFLTILSHPSTTCLKEKRIKMNKMQIHIAKGYCFHVGCNNRDSLVRFQNQRLVHI